MQTLEITPPKKTKRGICVSAIQHNRWAHENIIGGVKFIYCMDKNTVSISVLTDDGKFQDSGNFFMEKNRFLDLLMSLNALADDIKKYEEGTLCE